MKFILALLLTSNLALASGKISVAPTYHFGPGKTTPTVGVSVYEHLGGGVAYNGWGGVGWQPRVADETVMWMSTKQELETWFENIGLAAGYSYTYADQDMSDVLLSSEHRVYVKGTLKLW